MSRMAVRIVLGTALTAAVAGLMVWDHDGRHRFGLTLLLALAAGVGLGEFYALARLRGFRPAAGPAIALAVFLVVLRGATNQPVFSAVGWPALDETLARWAFQIGEADVWLAGLVWALAETVLRAKRRSIEDVWATCFGILYVWLPLSLAFPLHTASAAGARVGEALLVTVFVSNKVSDSAAYFCGTAFGRHPMAPAISPRKTWEGAAGGFAAGTLAGVAALKLLAPEWGATGRQWAGGAALSATLVVAGQLGDLVESAIKRWAGAKDSAARLPEFGGMLDMIDGFLLSLPVAYLWMQAGGGRWIFGPA